MEHIELNKLQIPPREASENSRQYAYRVLFGGIMSLAFAPGMVLSDAELSSMLKISRTPIREAIVHLLDSRLVEVYPQRSSCVSRINLDYVEEGVFLRHAAETAILKVAIQKSTAADIAALRENLSLQKMRLEERRYNEFVELDNAFHRLIYLAAQKPWTWSTLTRITTHLNRVRLLQIRAGNSIFNASYEEHRQLFEAIVSQDESDRSAFLYAHLTAGYRAALPYLLAQFPSYFTA